ncbi:MAG: undecaprenyldiphospho-muramoylpentapeptide beta-N-acetylglucosaminyltransferase [Endomicrobium sp.]|jgi:UDP-N-acetylglucosamine--N-acetylmuramyl-(pentapeptide) pyrophosphoryl-undecaprenol N-acetylglucosamine transferase|nr:undecaprenyldiphospho-muramoylpentapeptide beta-N-acetylglucosaminyltransferase [Endomicrobium sp.]
MKNKNIIIAASGTGGHIYPGIALAQELKEKKYNPVFFVSNNETSGEIIKNSGFDYVSFNLFGMPRKISFSFAVFFIKLIFAFLKALKNMFKLNPIAVIGVGGYISAPAVIAAKIYGKKTFIHEQNTIPGIANKFLNRFAGKTFISFRDSEKYFKNKKSIIFTGYPVRKEILAVERESCCNALNLDKNMFTLMIFGGSLGALKLNKIAFKAIKIISEKMDIQVIHITGKKGFEEINQKIRKSANYRVFDYMHNIAQAYAASDAVICRAGAGTVFELTFLKKPAILVPYPYAADNHQYYNAKEAARNGMMTIIEEKDLTAENLAGTVENIKRRLKPNIKNSVSKFPQEIMAEEIINGIS